MGDREGPAPRGAAGFVQGSPLGLQIGVSTFKSVDGTFRSAEERFRHLEVL